MVLQIPVPYTYNSNGTIVGNVINLRYDDMRRSAQLWILAQLQSQLHRDISTVYEPGL